MLLIADGFDHWGTVANMQLGPWQYLTNDGVNNMSVSTDNPRTGPYSIKMPSNGSLSYNQLRFIWDGASSTVGIGFAHYVGAAYTGNVFGVCFTDLVPNNFITVLLNSNNAFEVYRGNGSSRFATLLATSPVNSFRPGSFNYIEVKTFLHSVNGYVEIRVNSGTVMIVNGNTGTTGSIPSSVYIGKLTTSAGNGAAGHIAYIDDLVVWDDTGDINNDFLGDIRCATTFPDADAADMDWLPSAGPSGWDLIDDVPPNTGSYIIAGQDGDIAEFEKAPINVVATDVRAVVLFALARKEDAGPSNIRLGVNSASIIENSVAYSLGTGWAYYQAVFEKNPNGTIPWTKAAVDAANIRLTRED